LINTFIDFEKPIVAAVHGAAIGGGTTMLTHCDFVYAGETARFQTPFINLALVPEFAATFSVPMRLGYLRAAELLQLGLPFDANRAAELGLVTRVVPDSRLLETATDTAQKLTEKPAAALQASKRLMKKPWRDALLEAARAENSEFSIRVRSAESKEAISAFFEKRPPDFTWSRKAAVA
jgi:enoyl-CoA hydratase/carnithine racemase